MLTVENEASVEELRIVGLEHLCEPNDDLDG
jgi:hypothetical protein